MKSVKFITAAALFLLLCGCARNAPADETQNPAIQYTQPEVHYVEMEFTGLAEPPKPAMAIVLEPEAPGTAEERSSDAVIDYSNAADGYVMAQFLTETDARLKVLIKGPTTTYTYNLPQGQWEVFPPLRWQRQLSSMHLPECVFHQIRAGAVHRIGCNAFR